MVEGVLVVGEGMSVCRVAGGSLDHPNCSSTDLSIVKILTNTVKARRRSKDSCGDAATELSLIESSNQKVSDGEQQRTSARL
jgi:hypothetical protein